MDEVLVHADERTPSRTQKRMMQVADASSVKEMDENEKQWD